MPPGGQKPQEKQVGKLPRIFRASRAATPAPRLWPVRTSCQPCMQSGLMSQGYGVSHGSGVKQE